MRILVILYIVLSLLIPNTFAPAKIAKEHNINLGITADLAKSFQQHTQKIQPAKLKQSIGAWLPYWDQENAHNSFMQNKKIINELSPYWYFVKPNGQLSASSKFDMNIIKEAKKNGIKVIPMVSNNFDGARISKIINNTNLRRAHVSALVDKVVKRDLAGIDLDYEGLLAKDRKMYAYFVKVLAEKLHQKGKMLSITVVAKTKEPGLSSGAKAQSWKEIGKYANRLRIMAYDYHWKTSAPGPIAPKYWIEQIAKFAKKSVPSRKAIMAIGTYGYNWKGGRAQAITMAQARQLAKTKKSVIRRDAKSHEQFLKIGPGKPRIWLQDSGALKAKLKIVKKYNLGGVVFWRLGDEDAKTWRVVKEHLR